jgi:DnaK suppressor protein
MLNDQQRDELRSVLTASRDRVLATAQSAIELSRDREADQGRDSIDQSNSEEMLSTQLRLADREQRLLRKVQKALGRLEADEIDECEDCGESIGFKRLLARPVTTLCIGCKEEAEAEERQRESADRETADAEVSR